MMRSLDWGDIGRVVVGGGVLLLAGLAGGAVGRAATEEPPVPSVLHVLIVEDSGAMDRQRESAADLASRLMLDGFGGRAAVGDTVELWLWGEQLETNAMPSLAWDVRAAVDPSTKAFRLLESLKWASRPVGVELLIANLLPVPESPRIVYLVSSGEFPLVGTPFDNAVNAIFKEHSSSMRKSRLPFVTVMVSQRGRWLEHAVTPGDRTPFIPPFPKPPKPAPAPPPPAEPRIGKPLIYTNAPKVLTVDEIERKLREAAEERARTNPPAPAASVSTNRPAPAVEAVVAPQVVTEMPKPPEPVAAPVIPPPATEVAQVAMEAAEVPAGEASAVPAAPPVVEVPPWDPPAPRPRPVPASTEVISPGQELTKGILLLVAAGLLTVIVLRNLPWRGGPSLITRSLGGEDPKGRNDVSSPGSPRQPPSSAP